MEEDIENIRKLIRSNKHPSYETTNHKEVIVVCPYCNDSKHKDAGKFYISMTPPFKFHCFRCETSGVLNQQVLRDLEIYDTDLNLSIINSNKNYRSTQDVQHINYRKNTLKNEVTNSEIGRAHV